MALGRATLQTKILDKLRNQDSYGFQRVLLWDIAGDRGVIKKTGLLCPGIEIGNIKESFIGNFRRAIERLGKARQIEIKDERLTNLHEALSYFPLRLLIRQSRFQWTIQSGKLMISKCELERRTGLPLNTTHRSEKASHVNPILRGEVVKALGFIPRLNRETSRGTKGLDPHR